VATELKTTNVNSELSSEPLILSYGDLVWINAVASSSAGLKDSARQLSLDLLPFYALSPAIFSIHSTAPSLFTRKIHA
jgi:hypothetical protein